MNIIIFIIFYTLYIFLCCLFNNKILIFLQKIKAALPTQNSVLDTMFGQVLANQGVLTQ